MESLWEISLKFGIGKLEIGDVRPEDLPGAARETGFKVIDLSPDDAASFHRLPRLAHKDPFDRMLVRQAIRGKLTLISRDRQMEAYRQWGLEILDV